jgi:hypothetical protein
MVLNAFVIESRKTRKLTPRFHHKKMGEKIKLKYKEVNKNFLKIEKFL